MLINDFKLCILGHFHHLLSITQCCLAPNVTSASSTSKSNQACWKAKKPEKKKTQNAEAQRFLLWARVWINSRSLRRRGSNFDFTDQWNPLDVRCLQRTPRWREVTAWAMKALCQDTLKRAGVKVEPSNARAPLKPEGRRSPSACSTWPRL